MLQDAVEWMVNHPAVKKPGIGLVGVSKGAEFAMYMSIVDKRVGKMIIRPY